MLNNLYLSMAYSEQFFRKLSRNVCDFFFFFFAYSKARALLSSERRLRQGLLRNVWTFFSGVRQNEEFRVRWTVRRFYSEFSSSFFTFSSLTLRRYICTFFFSSDTASRFRNSVCTSKTLLYLKIFTYLS